MEYDTNYNKNLINESRYKEVHRLYGDGLRLREWAGERVASDQLLLGDGL